MELDSWDVDAVGSWLKHAGFEGALKSEVTQRVHVPSIWVLGFRGIVYIV